MNTVTDHHTPAMSDHETLEDASISTLKNEVKYTMSDGTCQPQSDSNTLHDGAPIAHDDAITDFSIPAGMHFPASRALPVARSLFQTKYVGPEGQMIRHHQGSFWIWTGSHYRQLPDSDVQAILWRWLETCTSVDRQGNTIQFPASARVVNDIVSALRGLCAISGIHSIPNWIGESPENIPLDRCLVLKNGILNVETGELVPNTPRLFNVASLPVQYDPLAPEPVEWLKFLKSAWPDDPSSIKTLQEVFGYFLAPKSPLQKIIYIKGVTRSGKGTIAQILRHLIGDESFCSPTMKSLEGEFGMQQLLGKQLAVFGDARVEEKAPSHSIVERLLTISGGDSISINRKNSSFVETRLSTRLCILSNNVLKLADSSGAIVGRMVALGMEESFLGREDYDLLPRLLKELPGILKWGLEGLRRLNSKGKFTEAESGKQVLEDMRCSATPITMFVEDCCELNPEAKVLEKDLYAAFCNWATATNEEKLTKHKMTRDLKQACPKIGKFRPSGEVRPRYLTGIGLNSKSLHEAIS